MQKCLTFCIYSFFPCPCLSNVKAVLLRTTDSTTLSSFTLLFAHFCLCQYRLCSDMKHWREILIQNIECNRKCWHFPCTFLYRETFPVIVFTRTSLICIVKNSLIFFLLTDGIRNTWHWSKMPNKFRSEAPVILTAVYVCAACICSWECCMQHKRPTYHHISTKYQLREYYKFA